ncbi:MAG: HprK-related kinase A [Proteobacteria bacterium]|nr:HprK-related kinase A [Pseudomonadota bacterium]
MKVAEVPQAQLARELRGAGLYLRTGPVVSRIRSRIGAVARGIALHYAEHALAADEGYADFHISIERPLGLRRWIQPQVLFRFDDDLPFAPLPGDQGFPMLEWGLNWCVSAHCHQYLTIHAAVVERGGRALILPAPSGSGKSTLCAGLTFSGWRLLSDELTLIDPASGCVVPLPRPISLKNASIDAVRRFAADAVIGPVVQETLKGAVAHVKPPLDGVRRAGETAAPGWVVLPQFVAGSAARLEPLSRARAFMRLVDNAFNYQVHGRRGFDVLAALIERCDCYTFTYSALADAATVFERLAAGSAPDA